jgi:murein DD-endopeptidase MepM/ murein hydrolase activator NlpD
MKHSIIFLTLNILIISFLGGCKLFAEENLAPIEYRGDKFYGFEEFEPESYDETTYAKLPAEEKIEETRNLNLDTSAGKQVSKNASIKPENKNQADRDNTEYKNASQWRRYYSVKSGDTLSGVAAKYKLSMSELAQLNDLEPPYKLTPGDKLLVRVQQPQVKDPKASAKTSGQTENKNKLADKTKTTSPAKTNNDKSAQRRAHTDGKANFIYPVNGQIISYFGKDKDFGIKNDGLNFSAPKGTNVKASQGGKIVYVGNELKGYGNLVIIRHDSNLLTAYAHLADLLPEKGEIVKQGQVIGHVGNSGYVKNAQLHFAIRYNNQPADPLKFLPIQNTTKTSANK